MSNVSSRSCFSAGVRSETLATKSASADGDWICSMAEAISVGMLGSSEIASRARSFSWCTRAAISVENTSASPTSSTRATRNG